MYDLKGARAAGFSDTDIATYLATLAPTFDLPAARAANFNDTAIADYLLPLVNKYETTIPVDQETAFQKWKAENAPKDSGADYDLRGAFLANEKADPVTGHWTDTFKKPNHPTFSDQSQYADYGRPGRWDGDTYIPAPNTNIPALDSTIAEAPPTRQEVGFFQAPAGTVASRGFLEEVASQIVAGALVDLPTMLGLAADWINAGSGKDLRAWAKGFEKDNPWLAPQLEGRSDFEKLFSQGARMIAPSLAAVGAAVAATYGAAVVGLGATTAAVFGTTASVLTTVGLFGASQAETTYEKLKADGVSEEDARTAGWLSGAVEAGGELLGGKFTKGLLKGVGGGFFTDTAAGVLKKSTSTAVLSSTGKSLLGNIAGEVSTEFAQGATQTAIETAFGAKNPQNPWVVGAEGGGAAFAMSVMLAPFGLRAQYNRAKEVAPLADAGAPTSERYRAAVLVHADLTAYDQENDTDLKAALKAIAEDKTLAKENKVEKVAVAKGNARKVAGDAWASNVWARNAGLAIQLKLPVDLSPEQLTAPSDPNARQPDIENLYEALFISQNEARESAQAATQPIPAVSPPVAKVLDGSKGTPPIVDRITDENESLDEIIVAAKVAVEEVPNPVPAQEFVDQGFEIVPSRSPYLTLLTKTNNDDTVRTVALGQNGVVEEDTTILGNFTLNDAPVSVRRDDVRKRLELITEDDDATELPPDVYSKYNEEKLPLLDILRAYDPSATIEPVARAETVAPAVTQAPLVPEQDAVEQNRDRSTRASVLQMGKIAAAPDYARAGVGTSLANDAPIVAGGNIPADQIGNKSVAADTEGNRVNIRYAVVDASTVQTSNTVDGAVNPNYAGSEDLRAIAGNGRIAGFSEAYARGTAGNYRAEFEADTAHGINPKAIRSVPNPILVRVMSEADITPNMGDRTNTATQLGMNPEETARNDANRVDLNTLDFRDNGEPTAEATRAFLRGLPPNEQATLLANQVPTADATTRLKRAIFFKAYNDPALMDQLTTSEDGRTVISALTQLAPAMSRLSDAGNLDVRDIVVEAAKIAITAGKNNIPLSEAARQTDMERSPLADLVVASMAAKPGGVKNTVAALRSVAEFAYAEATKPETDMLGPVPRAARADVEARLRAALTPKGAQPVRPGPEAVDTGGIATEQQAGLKAQIADLNLKADTQGRRTVAGRILSLTAAHLAAPTKESRTKLELALTNKTATTATYNTNVQVAEAVDAARAALAPAPTEQTAQLAVGDSVRVGNVMGVVVGVEDGYIKFHPITAKNPKAYQRVPTTTVTLISRPDTSATSAKSETVGLSVDLAQMAERFGADMYGSSLMEVVVKEGLQNSFDAVKGRLFLEMAAKKTGVADLSDAAQIALFEAYLLANPKIFGHVKITLNSVDRTVTFSDDGVGMSPDIVKNAFLTIAASNKAGLPAGLASGGLGLAKMGILMGAARIQLTTVKGGVQTSIDTTKTELLKNVTIFNVNKTKEPSGTTLTLTIPKTFTAKNGDEVGIYFNSDPDTVTALKRPLVGPVEVEVTSIDSYRTRTKVIATGVNFDTSGYQKVKTADTDWGRINIYFGVDRKQNPRHVVLSSGVYQFDYDIRDASYEKIPFDIVLNIQPKDKASERDYPFENSRERFKSRVDEDLNAIQAYLLAIARGESAKDLKEGFKNVVSMPRIEVGAALADNSKKLKKAFDARNSGEVEELAPLPDEVTITSGTVIDTRGAVIAQSDAAAKEAEKKSPSTFVEKEAAPDVAAFMSDMKADPRQPAFLNNTSVDYLAVGRPYGNPEAFFAELGTLMVEMKEELAKSGLYGYDALSAKELFFGGIAIDRKYGGVHIRVPFKAVFVNPFYDWGAKTLFGVTENLYETMTHEIAHVQDMSHGVGHNNEMIRVRQYLADGATAQYFRDAILDLLIRHESTFTAMRTAYGQSTTKNIGKPLDEYKGNTPSTSPRGSTAGVQGELGPVRAGEGLGRSGDLPAVGGVGEQGQVSGGSGKGAAVATTGYLPPGDPQREANLARHMEGSVAPFVLYHGTGVQEAGRGKDARPLGDIDTFDRYAAFKAFNRSEGMDAVGTWLDESPGETGAGMYAGSTGAIYPVHASLKNPWKFKSFDEFLNLMHTTAGRDPKAQTPKGLGTVGPLRDYLMSRGYDSIVFPPGTVDNKDQGRVWVALNPESQLKSAIGNNGQFSPDTGDIRYSVKSDKMGAVGTAKAWIEFAEAKKLIDFGVVKTLVQARAAAEADYTKTFEDLPAFDAKAYLEGVVAVEGPFLPPNIQAAIQAYRNGDEGGAVGTLLADVERAREQNVARWKNYFNNVNTEQGSDPFWKSYVARGVVGTFDATKPNTGESFNAAALAAVYGKFLEGAAPNFTKAYRAAKMAATADLVQLGDAQNGWRKVPQTAKSDPDFAERVAEVQAISSESWCTRTYNAAPYIAEGDFWVYVDKGRPELAIRFERSNVAEIQGRANNGSIPSQYADKVQELVDSGKIQNLKPETKRALQTATDRSIALKKLELEATFVEEIVGPDNDGDSIRVYKKTNGDIVFVTEGWPTLPAKYADTLVEVIGNLTLYDGAQANSVTTVGGNLNLYDGAQANSVTTVGGDLILHDGAQANSVTTVGGDLTLSQNAQANNLTTVGGNLTLYKGAQANSVTTVGGGLYLYYGAQANSVTTVGGGLTLYDDAQANSVTTVGGDLNLREGAQANSVTTVGGNLILYDDAQANNLTTVGGDLTLYKGAQANNLTTVGGNLTLSKGAQANSVTTVGGNLYLSQGAQALSLQAVGGRVSDNAGDVPNLKHVGDKEAVERIKAQTLAPKIPERPSATAEVQKAIADATKNLRIKTNVYATVAQARAATGVNIPANAQGMYFRNELHFITDNISSDLDAEITIWHETTHAGLDRLFGIGSSRYNAALTTLALRNPEIQKEAAKWRAEFGPDMLAYQLRLGRTQEQANQYIRVQAIDEALAVMSSQNVTLRGLDAFIATVQNILRQVGLNRLADAIEGKTNAEALALIRKTRGALLADGSYVVTGTAPAFLRGAGLQNQPLNLTGTGPNGRILNWDLGQAFTRAHKARYGRVLDIDNPADRAEMVRSLNAEYRNQTRQPDNGEEWYVEDIAKALKITRAILPELRVPSNRDLFLTIAALTSPQQKPNQNWQNAVHAMRGYIETGQIALVKPNGKAFGVLSHTTGLQLLQHLIDTKGLKKALRWLNSPHSGQELAEVRRDSGIYAEKKTLGGSRANETTLAGEYLGIAMFGPKVSEFMLNATGMDPNAVTVDLWLARTYNRLLGRLTDVSPKNKEKQKIQSDIRSPTERNSIKSLIRDVAAQNGISPSAMQAALWYFEQRLYRRHGLNAPSQNFSGAAELAVGAERPGGTGDVRGAGRNEIPAVSGRGKNRKVVESIPYNAVQTTTRLNKLEEETDPVALKDGVAALARDLRRQANAKPVPERARGYNWIQERLLRAARLGEMNREQVRLGMWLLNSNPNLANDLGISLKTTKSDAASGNYNPMARIMTLFKGRGEDTLIAHEILHHAERMMPREVQDGIRAEWLSQVEGMLAAAIRTGDAAMVKHLRDTLLAAAGDMAAYNRVVDAMRNGTLPQDFYQYINPSEFWAVNAADIVAGRASESWVGRAVQWLKEFRAKIQELFGFSSNAAVIRGLDSVINAANEGERQSPNMLSGGRTFNAPPLLSPAPSGGVDEKIDQLTYNYVDRFTDLKELIDNIKTRVGALRDDLNVYSMVERLPSIISKKYKDFTLRELKPLMTEMELRKVSVNDLGYYLWMKAASDANRIIENRPPKMKDGAGVSTVDAEAWLARLTPEQQKNFEALAKRVYAMQAKTRREWVTYGLATLEDVIAMEAEQPFYVPLNRLDKGKGYGSGQGVSVLGPNTYYRKGSLLPVVDVLANIIEQRNRAVSRGEKNRIARAIYALAKAIPQPDFWSLAKPGTKPAIDADTGEPVNILDMGYKTDPNVLMSVRLGKDGKLIAQGVAFNKADARAMRLVGALKNLDLPPLQDLSALMAPVTRYFAALNTQYNPVFGVINLFRDTGTALLNLTSTPIAGKQVQVFTRIGPSLKVIYGGERARRSGRSAKPTELERMFERLQVAGGTSGWRQSFETSADRTKALQKELDSLSKGTASKILPAIGGWLTDYNTAMENATRLAAFSVAVESGMTDAAAASLAKNLTVNFDRKGAKSSGIGAWFAFFNPSVQGTARMIETLRGPAGKKIIAGGLLLGALQAVAFAVAGFDDDDPPEFVRQRNIVIPTFDGNYVLIPMPLGFNLIPNIGRLVMETVIQPQNGGKNLMLVFDAALSTLNPFGSGITPQTITPTALDPIMALASNTDWTGRPIERKDFSDLDPTPGFTRATDNATFISTVLAEAINTLTLGDKYTRGALSPTPDMIDYVAGQLTGGPGRELINLEKTLSASAKGEEVPTYTVPLIGRFYGNTGSESSQKARYYENIATLNVLENNVKGRKNSGEGTSDYKTANPMVRLIKSANRIKRAISDLRAEKKEPGSDDASLDAKILAKMQKLNELAAPYNSPTAQQKFLRFQAPE